MNYHQRPSSFQIIDVLKYLLPQFFCDERINGRKPDANRKVEEAEKGSAGGGYGLIPLSVGPGSHNQLPEAQEEKGFILGNRIFVGRSYYKLLQDVVWLKCMAHRNEHTISPHWLGISFACSVGFQISGQPVWRCIRSPNTDIAQPSPAFDSGAWKYVSYLAVVMSPSLQECRRKNICLFLFGLVVVVVVVAFSKGQRRGYHSIRTTHELRVVECQLVRVAEDWMIHVLFVVNDPVKIWTATLRLVTKTLQIIHMPPRRAYDIHPGHQVLLILIVLVDFSRLPGWLIPSNRGSQTRSISSGDPIVSSAMGLSSTSPKEEPFKLFFWLFASFLFWSMANTYIQFSGWCGKQRWNDDVLGMLITTRPMNGLLMFWTSKGFVFYW